MIDTNNTYLQREREREREGDIDREREREQRGRKNESILGQLSMSISFIH
jgi:hypothetical protein